MGAAQKARTRTRCRSLFLARKGNGLALRGERKFTVCKPLSLWMPSRDLPDERGTRETRIVMTSPKFSRIPVRIFLAFILLLFSFSVKVSATQQSGLAAIPSSNNFGTVPVGSSKTATETLTNSGNGKVTVSQVTITGAGFSLSGVSLPFTIAAGKSASFTVKFVPQTSGSASGSLSFKSNATTSTTVEALSGSGTAGTSHSVALTWSPESAVSGYNVYRGTKSGGPYSKINPVLDASASFTHTAVQAGHTYYYVTSAVSVSGLESKYSNQVKAVIPTP